MILVYLDLDGPQDRFQNWTGRTLRQKSRLIWRLYLLSLYMFGRLSKFLQVIRFVWN